MSGCHCEGVGTPQSCYSVKTLPATSTSVVALAVAGCRRTRFRFHRILLSRKLIELGPTVKIFTNPAKNRPRITSPVGSDNPHAGFGGDGQTAMVTPTLLFSTNSSRIRRIEPHNQ